MNSNIYSRIPKVDQIIENEKIKSMLEINSRELVIESIREELDDIRKIISKGDITLEDLDNRINKIYDNVTLRVQNTMSPKFKRVINCTGVVIHTNLGRSLINEEVMKYVSNIATKYSNLEFDLETGARGSRYSHLEDIIKKITGAEAALVVNNNAAAVVLVLSALAKEKEVVVSRGELVEIGGSFRIPDVMEQSGAKLVDVGTTNKTHIWDYERAIGEETAALLKVHTSNYRILGFTSSISLDELVELGKKKEVAVIEDLGSGVLIDLSKYGLEYEPTVQDSINSGVDVVTFSGDKLLGGPQAGIIVGKKKYIDMMKKHPLNRALRIDKFTIATLEGTLRFYLDEDKAIENIPTLRMLTTSINDIEIKANKLLHQIKNCIKDKLDIQVVDEFSQVGGGSLPLEKIPTKCIMISSDHISVTSLERKLRENEIPIITRLYKDRLYMDLRTIDETEFEIIIDGIKSALQNI
ncbi:L-seryl-tRNA(Sec) selenium transferase SelA [Gottschalkia purinilytica]|uniref:L-seryl-tRNA(Sec) selenium transferase n=1 Tax=Gottschalkia purinilytica TaxID=1503 RepID=A0A0L0WDA6_GOTPU|nr:L-seryl-tRNA(Sec) selenium transferase [Gottschalkia purinilytica]KNF09426.1 L-seryl-tRNA(Sec) selenium transferase SelA [Gottschalkia purinilytica]